MIQKTRTEEGKGWKERNRAETALCSSFKKKLVFNNVNYPYLYLNIIQDIFSLHNSPKKYIYISGSIVLVLCVFCHTNGKNTKEYTFFLMPRLSV